MNISERIWEDSYTRSGSKNTENKKDATDLSRCRRDPRWRRGVVGVPRWRRDAAPRSVRRRPDPSGGAQILPVAPRSDRRRRPEPSGGGARSVRRRGVRRRRRGAGRAARRRGRRCGEVRRRRRRGGAACRWWRRGGAASGGGMNRARVSLTTGIFYTRPIWIAGRLPKSMGGFL
jgi:hypothetical protein